MTPEQCVLFLYAPTWDRASQVSKHHLARYWAKKGWRVLYVEDPFHPLSLATRPAETRRLWRRFVGGPTEVAENLWVQAYPSIFPYRAGWPLTGARWMLRLNQTVARRGLKSVCDRLGIRRPLVLVGSALATPLLDALEPALVVYHCSDDYTRQPTFPDGYADLERALIGI